MVCFSIVQMVDMALTWHYTNTTMQNSCQLLPSQVACSCHILYSVNRVPDIFIDMLTLTSGVDLPTSPLVRTLVKIRAD